MACSSPDWPNSPLAVRRYNRSSGSPERYGFRSAMDGRDSPQRRSSAVQREPGKQKKSRRSISDTRPPNIRKVSDYEPPPGHLVKSISENTLNRAGSLSDVMRRQASLAGKLCDSRFLILFGCLVHSFSRWPITSPIILNLSIGRT